MHPWTRQCSGKNCLTKGSANISTEFIPDHERIVLIDDTAEIQIQKPNVLGELSESFLALVLLLFRWTGLDGRPHEKS